ncbi:MAG: pteridine reductase [Gammaproteobacteria bacterium]|jgi:pteridine reductase|nr:pteridine reductase [Gammaproteobacteria bacterium]
MTSAPASDETPVALVTGSARRLGASIVRALHARGFRVAIHHRSSSNDARRLAEELDRSRAGSAAVFRADLLDLTAVRALPEEILERWGRLDVLVNNASSFYPTPLGSIDEQTWNDLIGTNLKAPVFLAQSAREALARDGGSIVNLIDIHARRPLREHIVYGVAKAGLEMLTRTLARELAPRIRVNGVAPGAILWQEGLKDESIKRQVLRQIPLGRLGTAEDVAAAVVFLVCDAPYVTGHILTVDGGRSIGW